MKKIYAFAAFALALSVSASAAVLPGKEASAKKNFSSVSSMEMVEMTSSLINKQTDKLETKAVSAADVEGLYALQGYSMLEGKTGWNYGSFTVSLSADGKKASLTGLSFSDFPVTGDFDADKGTITIPNEISYGDLGFQISAGVEAYGYFKYMRWNDDGKGYYFPTTPLVMTYQNGRLVLDSYDIFTFCVGNSAGEILGYYMLAYGYSTAKIPSTLSNDGWVDGGEADFTDGWVYPDETSYKVKIQKSTTTEGLVRIVNPYGKNSNAPAEVKNMNSANYEGAILIDLTNPDCPLGVPEVLCPAGFAEEGLDFWCYTDAGHFFYTQITDEEDPDYQGVFTREELLEGLGADAVGKKDGQTITLELCTIGLGYNLSMMDNETMYVTDDQKRDPIYYPCTLTLPEGFDLAVEDIDVDNANAPVEYYNLQGVKVLNPEAGTLVIKKQGSKVSKLIVK